MSEIIDNSQPSAKFYFKGKMVPPSEALLPVGNRSMYFGESVFTTFRSYAGQFLFFDDHLERLLKGLEYMYGPFFPINRENWTREIKGAMLQAASQARDWDWIYRPFFFVTSETPSLREVKGSLELCIACTPLMPKSEVIVPELSEVTLFKKTEIRSNRPNFLKAPNYSYVARDMAQLGLAANCDFIFVNEADVILEASTSNIFFLKGTQFLTPKLLPGVLNGITRQKMIDCLRHQKIIVKEVAYKISDLNQCDGAFLTNSLVGMRPIAKFDTTEFSLTEKYAKIVKIFETYCQANIKSLQL